MRKPSGRLNGNGRVNGDGVRGGEGPSGPNGDNFDGLPGDLFADSGEMEQFGAKAAESPVLAQVVTYNVLSSSLAPPTTFKHCDPRDLEGPVRLNRVLLKLEEPVRAGAIICLQEISLAWAGPLHGFFARRGFHLVYASYGGRHNGYMGVGLAYPTDTFEAIDVSLERISDTRAWPMGRREGPFKALRELGERLRRVWKILFPPGRSDKVNPWEYSRERRNVLIFTRLISRINGSRLCLGTYHMPCAYWSPPVMLIHSALVVSRFQDLARGDDAVLAGDFNILPGSECYELITKGGGPAGAGGDGGSLPARAPDGTVAAKWMPTLVQPMKSAYAEKLGAEPDFTNFAQVLDDDPFVETLDYLFCSPQCEVVDVVRLPDRGAVAGPFPTRLEPSDHILLGATFRLLTPSSARRYGAAVSGSHYRGN